MCEGGRLASSEDGHDGRFEIKREPAPNERLGIGCALVTPNSWEAEAVKIERDLFLTFRSVETCGDDPEADPPAPPRRVVTPALFFLRAQIHTYHSSPPFEKDPTRSSPQRNRACNLH
ncbi:hypothetical protein T09_302 [Trichinella sp. T9]|nr:hypothetical protein T09_302 [Trichinella sp. T9]